MRFLLTGGSACGKSYFAESLACRLGQPRYYLAAMKPEGDEAMERVARHRLQRSNKGFLTVERYVDIAGLRLQASGGVLLLECMGNLLANEMYEPEASGEAAVDAILGGIEAVEEQCEHLIVISNEIGADGCNYDLSVEAYIKNLAYINASLAEKFEMVYEFCCGIPILLKGALM